MSRSACAAPARRRVAALLAAALAVPALAVTTAGPASADHLDPVGSGPGVIDPVGSKPPVDPVGSKPPVDPVGSKPPVGPGSGTTPPANPPVVTPPVVTPPVVVPPVTTPPPAKAPVLPPGSSKIVAGAPATVQGTAPVGSVVRLYAYTRPSTVYRLVRTVTVGESGTWAFSVKPGGNTRMYATVDGGEPGPSVVVTVAQSVTANAVRVGRSGVKVTGRVGSPTAGQLVSVYYTGAKGKALAGRTRTKAGGTFEFSSRQVKAKGVVAFTAETAGTIDHASGASSPKKVSLR